MIADELFADLALVNGKVVTVDSHFSLVQAIAIKDNKIVAVGTNEKIKKFTGKHTEVRDLKGKAVLPGINDSHLHAVDYGGSRPPFVLDVGYPGIKSIRDIARAVGEKAKTLKPGEWVRGSGWDEGYLEECLKDPGRHPTRWDLDEASPRNPVCLIAYTGHEVWANSLALEMAAVTADTPLPLGGEIVKGPANGEVSGILRESPAMDMVMKLVPRWDKAYKRQSILTMMRELNTRGITSITDASLGPGGGDGGGLMDSECISVYNDLSNEGQLSLRVSILYLLGQYGGCSFADFQQFIPQIGIHSGFGNNLLRLAGIKIFADGTPFAKTAWMYDDYPDGGNGSLVLPGKDDKERAEELKRMILYAHKYGFQLGIHTVGSQATGLCIESFIQAEREEPKGLRHYIIHGDFISDRDIDLAARHSIGLNAQPVLKWVFSESIDRAVGEELSARQWPLRKIIDAGVHVSAGSDAPVTAPDWLQGIQYAVRRVSRSGTVRGLEHRITVAEAIRLFTMGGAWQDHAEHIKGSLEAGKLADLCILDRDILNVAPEDIKDIRNLMTIVDGKVVYDTGEV